MGSWNTAHRGRSLGRILHFVYHYTNFDTAEKCQVGEGNIWYHGKVIATYEWLSDTDIPLFKFLPNVNYRGDDLQSLYETNQRNRWAEAIADAQDAKPEECKNCRSLKLRLDIIESGMKL